MGSPFSRLWRGALNLGLRKKVAIVFTGILVFAGVNLVLLQSMLQDFNGVAATATEAGRLRMLGQKLAFEAISVSTGLSGTQEGIEHDIVDFEAAYLTLRSGGQAFSEDIRPLAADHAARMNAVWLAWRQYRNDIRAVLAPLAGMLPHDEVSRRQRALASSSNSLLEHTDALIGDLVHEAQSTQRDVLQRMYVLLGLNALALLFVYVAVSQQFVEPLQRLARHCGELAKGNYGVRTRHAPGDEIGQLAKALNHSGQKIGELMGAIERERNALRRTSAMFQGVARNAVVGVFAIDGNMRFRYVNRKLADMFGYRPEEIVNGSTVHDFLVAKEDGARWDRLAVASSGPALSTSHYESRGRHRNGQAIDIEVFASRMVLDGAPAVIGIVLNVTERRKAEASARRAALVYTNTSEAVVVTDPDGRILDVNPAFMAITGFSLQEVAGRSMNTLASGRHDASFYHQMWESLGKTGKWSGHVWNRRKSGEEYVERLAIDTSYNEDGSVNCRIGVFCDVTAERLKGETIWRQAHFDHLTGLPNRQMFHQQLQRAMKRSDESGQKLALIFLDLDLFKEVNDSLGHDKGDELLQEIAKRLSHSVREADVVARLGGDEFTLLLEVGDDETVIEQICVRALQAISEPFQLGQLATTVSASLGVTCYPRDAQTAVDLLKCADLAMYHAKDSGRNQFRHFSMSMQLEAQQRRELLRELQGALERSEFELYFQPIVELSTLTICKAEALLRWRHPTRGVVAPGDFVPLAEDSGLIVPIGDWVFREAARHTAQWRKDRANFQVSVNVSPVQFMSADVHPAAWLGYVNGLGMSGSAVLVEITERLLITADGAAKNKLLAFRDAGVQVALDDFGTGYSSLAYLKRFDIDYIKIDQLFVRNITTDPDDLALCQAIIVMAHRLGLKVVAEGVASRAQHELLRRSGCDYAQGFLYSQPVSAPRFDALLASGLQPWSINDAAQGIPAAGV